MSAVNERLAHECTKTGQAKLPCLSDREKMDLPQLIKIVAVAGAMLFPASAKLQESSSLNIVQDSNNPITESHDFIKIEDFPIVETKITPSDGDIDDSFGRHLAIDGDILIAGASRDDDAGDDSGSVYVFLRDGGVWSEETKLNPAGLESGDRFGSSIAMQGDTVVIGAVGDDDQGEGAGAVYVFQRIENRWIETAKLTASDGKAGDWFGYPVAIDGDTIVLGARLVDGGSGAAYVFRRRDNGWFQEARLDAWLFSQEFGRGVAVSGDTIAVGGPFDTSQGTSSGAVFMFQKVDGVWSPDVKLTANDQSSFFYFGHSVAIEDDVLVVGAFSANTTRVHSAGAVYVFKRDGSGWHEVAKLFASDGTSNDVFGFGIAIDGDTILVGADNNDAVADSSGAAYIFRDIGGRWLEEAKITASDGAEDDRFGSAVALRGNIAAISSAHADALADNSGAAYLFDLPLIGIEKKIVDGPDLDANASIDVVVQPDQNTTTTYAFDITYSNPGGPDVAILDIVPREWRVVEIAGQNVNLRPNSRRHVRLPDGVGGRVDAFLINSGLGGTLLLWRPAAANDASALNVVVATRGLPLGSPREFAPFSCGPFLVNQGAEAFELHPTTGRPLRDPETGELLPPILESNPLTLAAVEDLDGGGLVGGGRGDEDGDGLSDGHEVFTVGTDPCNPDSDGDGVIDGDDICPTEGDLGNGVDSIGCPIP